MPLVWNWKLAWPVYLLVPDLLTESIEKPPERSKFTARAPPLTIETSAMS